MCVVEAVQNTIMLPFSNQQPGVPIDNKVWFFLISDQVTTEHAVRLCSIRIDSVSTNMARHTFLLTWPQRNSQPTEEPLPTDGLLKLGMKTCTWNCSCKLLATWAWSDYSDNMKRNTWPSEVPGAGLLCHCLFSVAHWGLECPVILCEWWKRREGREGGTFQPAEINH